MSGISTVVRRHQRVSKRLIEMMPTEWQEIARIRTRWTAVTGEITEPVEFARVLRWMERKGLVESTNRKPMETEGVLWRRKERG
jgi:hypothetical protein